MDLYWLLRQSVDVLEGDEWLSPSERVVLAGLWAPKRRRDWRLGRWTAKLALARAGALATGDVKQLAEWARMSIDANSAGVPCLFLDGGEADWGISISHSGDFGLAAVVHKPAAIGCDIEAIGRRGEEFVVDWFTESERAAASQADPEAKSRMVTVIWSAKESALKTLGVGLRLDTRQVEVRLGRATASSGEWQRLVVGTPGGDLCGWWTIQGSLAMTLISDAAAAEPIAL